MRRMIKPLVVSAIAALVVVFTLPVSSSAAGTTTIRMLEYTSDHSGSTGDTNAPLSTANHSPETRSLSCTARLAGYDSPSASSCSDWRLNT